MVKKKYLIFLLSIVIIFAFSMKATAGYIEGGDAASLAAADVVLDIVFVSDTSASMNDEMSAISNTVQSIVNNIDCPDCDAWVRASFLGITGTYGIFNQTVVNYVSTHGGTAISNHEEDNGPAVTDMVNWYAWDPYSVLPTQDYYKAVVTIGDEGTENGYPADIYDWAAADVANNAAILNDVMVFSLVGTVYPASVYIADETNRNEVFTALAEGGSKYGYTLNPTGGKAIFTTSNTLEGDIEEIICTAVTGGVPEPATILLFLTGILGLAVLRRKKTL